MSIFRQYSIPIKHKTTPQKLNLDSVKSSTLKAIQPLLIYGRKPKKKATIQLIHYSNKEEA